MRSGGIGDGRWARMMQRLLLRCPKCLKLTLLHMCYCWSPRCYEAPSALRRELQYTAHHRVVRVELLCARRVLRGAQSVPEAVRLQQRQCGGSVECAVRSLRWLVSLCCR